MASRSATRAQNQEDKPVEEIQYRKGDVDFCFLLNRRHHNLRVFDYRVGNYQQKRDFFDRIAWSEGLRKVFTVVEKQDSKSWRSVGFSREGAIPGYFRTADAYIMSRVYTEDGEPIQGGAPKLNAPSYKPTEITASPPKSATHEIVDDANLLAKVARERQDSALYAPFRRHVFHPDVGLRAKVGRRDFWLGAETDSYFGHAKVDLLTTPDSVTKDEELALLHAGMGALLEHLRTLETASVFALVPVDAARTNELYATLGFKVTARLTDHLVREGGYVGVQLWHRRLTSANTPRVPSFI